MSGPSVLIARDGAVTTVTLSRPGRRNALDLDGWRALTAVLAELADDATVRAVILTGAGGDFCSGSDLGRRGDDHPISRMRHINAAALALAEFPKPLIAKVEGYAFGAGWNIALLCDLVVASRTAKFSQVFAKRGLSVDFGGSWLLPRLVGLHQAKRLVMLAEVLDGEQAHALGLVSELTAPEDLDEAAADLARRLAAGPPMALHLSARLLEQGSSLSLREALENEARSQAVNFATDAPDAVRAFTEKRAPAFDGAWIVGAGPVD
ncbi:enoyl-CoA hydratase/isomerase family protein [Tomitella biformata]|uniref:enoyl-CoA hydratase/isomerase family protein n=1 Tax=Tomitella biformata TaxID=630403 RepID=UPI000463CBCA|nr:enoyl-CoA hydratase-related protein [Tomitella biformata]